MNKLIEVKYAESCFHSQRYFIAIYISKRSFKLNYSRFGCGEQPREYDVIAYKMRRHSAKFAFTLRSEIECNASHIEHQRRQQQQPQNRRFRLK